MERRADREYKRKKGNNVKDRGGANSLACHFSTEKLKVIDLPMVKY